MSVSIDQLREQCMSALPGPLAVLYGGTASERSVSLESGAAVIEALHRLGIPHQAIDLRDDIYATLTNSGVRHAFICLHGVGGEDGRLQALLDTLSVTYTGSGVLASAVAMDKVMTKRVWRGMDLPTPAHLSLTPSTTWAQVVEQVGPRAVIKPVSEGSSIGMSIVQTAKEYELAYQSASAFGQHVFAETYIDGPEYTVAVVDGVVMPSIRIETPNTFYDFAAKYEQDDTQYLIPSGVSEFDEGAMGAMAAKAFAALGCQGWGRVDFMCDAATQEYYLLEVNTVPGMTSHSLVPMAAAYMGISFDELVLRILRASLTVQEVAFS